MHMVKIDGENVQVNPQLLFQRLEAVKENTPALFKYELCSHPSAFFDNSALPREANKPQLADALWAEVSDVQTDYIGKLQYAVDVGALLQWISGNMDRHMLIS